VSHKNRIQGNFIVSLSCDGLADEPAAVKLISFSAHHLGDFPHIFGANKILKMGVKFFDAI
jgi:hypothetical protein